MLEHNNEVWVIRNRATGNLWFHYRGQSGGKAIQNAWPNERAAKTHFSRSNKTPFHLQEEWELVNLNNGETK